MKKLLILSLVGAMLVSASACTRDEADVEGEITEADTTASEGTEADTAEETSEETAEADTAADDTEGETPDEQETAFDYNAALDENGFYKGIKASEIVQLPDYKGVTLSKADVYPTTEEIDEEFNYYFNSYPIYCDTDEDRAVADGDIINIDYVGSIDGVEFESGNTKGMGTYVTVGVTNYIDDFLEQLIGHKPGETVNVEVTFPEDYGDEELNGKDALFVTTINSFGAPDYDAFAELYGFADASEMRAYLYKNAYYTKVASCVGEILGAAECEEIPQTVLDYSAEAQFDYMVSVYSQYGLTAEALLEAMGYTSKEEYFADNVEAIEDSSVLVLAFQAIAEIEGLSVSDEYISELGITESDIETVGLPYLKQNILMSYVIPDFIIENANITE